jgi:hypothetical protein
MSNSLLLKIAIEVVDLPINSIVDLSSSLWDSLPEGRSSWHMDLHVFQIWGL